MRRQTGTRRQGMRRQYRRRQGGMWRQTGTRRQGMRRQQPASGGYALSDQEAASGNAASVGKGASAPTSSQHRGNKRRQRQAQKRPHMGGRPANKCLNILNNFKHGPGFVTLRDCGNKRSKSLAKCKTKMLWMRQGLFLRSNHSHYVAGKVPVTRYISRELSYDLVECDSRNTFPEMFAFQDRLPNEC